MFWCLLCSTWNPKANNLWNTRSSMKPASITAVAWWKKRSLEKMGELRKMTEEKEDGKKKKGWNLVQSITKGFLFLVGQQPENLFRVSIFSPAYRRKIPQRSLSSFGIFFQQAKGGLCDDLMSFLLVIFILCIQLFIDFNAVENILSHFVYISHFLSFWKCLSDTAFFPPLSVVPFLSQGLLLLLSIPRRTLRKKCGRWGVGFGWWVGSSYFGQSFW